MKELSIEEKAKRYDEAIKQLNNALNSMEHGGHLPLVEDKMISKEELDSMAKEISKDCEKEIDRQFDEIADKALYGKEPEMVDIDDLPKEEPVSDDLYIDVIKEELNKAVRIYKPNGDFGCGTLYNIACHFANWQRQQMMKKAIKGIVTTNIDGWINVMTGFIRPEEAGANFGNKVKLIIIKQEEE